MGGGGLLSGNRLMGKACMYPMAVCGVNHLQFQPKVGQQSPLLTEGLGAK